MTQTEPKFKDDEVRKEYPSTPSQKRTECIRAATPVKCTKNPSMYTPIKKQVTEGEKPVMDDRQGSSCSRRVSFPSLEPSHPIA
jgi:hypothetical protein